MEDDWNIKVAKMETDLEYIKHSVDENARQHEELRDLLAKQYKALMNQIDKKIDRTEVWKIIGLVGGVASFIVLMIELMLKFRGF